jgi:hypothetical protein
MMKMAGQASSAQQEETREYITQSGMDVSGLIVKFEGKDVLLRWDDARSRFVAAELTEFDWR